MRPQPVKLDLSPKHRAVRDQLLKHTYFPDSPAQSLDDLDDMDKQDPLQAQVWKMYKDQKAELPNKERMENLTWRMMNIKLRKMMQDKDKEAQDPARYGYQPVLQLREAKMDSRLTIPCLTADLLLPAIRPLAPLESRNCVLPARTSLPTPSLMT